MTDLASELRDIERKLFEIPDEKVAQLTLLIERSRAVVLSAGMANAALGTLRPRLAKTRPPRYLTLQRIFCHPFEDLLVMPEGGEKQFGRIGRPSLAPAWDFVVKRLDQAAVKQLEASLRKEAAPEIGATADPRIAKLGETLWSIGAKTLRQELSKAETDAAHRAALVAELGSEAVLADLADMAAMLELADPLEKLREELSPKPVGKLLDEQVEAIKESYAGVAASGAGLPGYIVAFVIARLSNAFQALPIFDGLGEHPTGLPGVKPGDFARRMIAADSKRFFGSVSRTDPNSVSDNKIADLVDDYVQLVGRLRADGMANDAPPEMDAASRRLKEMVKFGVLGDADAKVRGGIDITLQEGLDPEAAKKAVFEAKLEAETRVFALQKVAKVAGDIGAEKDVSGALKSLTQQIEEAGSVLIADIKGGKLAAEGKDEAKSRLFAAVRMLELVGGQQAAGKLMKDGMAAIAKM